MSDTRDRKEMTFWDHVEELRTRIVRCIIYVSVGTAVGWIFRSQILAVLRWPAESAAVKAHVDNFAFRIFEPAGGLILMLQMSFLAGIILASPLWAAELWSFFEPALEPHERRWAVPFVLMAVLLFLGGVAFCYILAPQCFWFFFTFNRGIGVEPELTLAPYLYFLMRFLLVVGLSFEVPIVLMLAGLAGLVTSSGMARYWRHATVACFVFSGAITPTTDPFTCTVVALPMVLLYVLSIGLVRFVERVSARERARQDAEREAQLAAQPVSLPDSDPYRLGDASAQPQGLSDPPQA